MPLHTHLSASVHSDNALAHITGLVKSKTVSELMNFKAKQSDGSGSCILDFRPKPPLGGSRYHQFTGGIH
jgi:hypothetical protein